MDQMVSTRTSRESVGAKKTSSSFSSARTKSNTP
jgi:hypothetical protein